MKKKVKLRILWDEKPLKRPKIRWKYIVKKDVKGLGHGLEWNSSAIDKHNWIGCFRDNHKGGIKPRRKKKKLFTFNILFLTDL